MSTIGKMMTQLLRWPLCKQCILAATDCKWVRIIYEEIGGDVSRIPADCCIMEGVICEGDRVTALYWNKQGLSGSIPPEIGNLVELRLLALGNNELSGPIPKEIGNLVNLVGLFLNKNQLSGFIPKEIGNLVNLEVLYFGDNHFSGTIPKQIGNLVYLEVLYLQQNQLSGSIPEEIGNLRNLRWLKMSGNHLNGEIPQEIGNLRNLLKLELRKNSLSGTLPNSMTNLGQLEILDLSNNELEGSFPEWVHGLADLKVLNLGQNGFTGDVPLVIGGRLNSLRDHFRPQQTQFRRFQEEYPSLRGKFFDFFRTHYRYLRDSKDFLWLSRERLPDDYKDYVAAYIEAEKERLLPSILFYQINFNANNAVKAVGKYIQRLPSIHDGNPATKRQRLTRS